MEGWGKPRRITAVPSPSSKLFIPKGTTSVRQFFALLPSEQRVARIRITGAQLRAYLEHAARYYNFSHLPDLTNKEVPMDDFDVLDGVSYALDISRPLGSRVVALSFQGQAVKPDQEFTLGISERRLAGKGGYLQAMGESLVRFHVLAEFLPDAAAMAMSVQPRPALFWNPK